MFDTSEWNWHVMDNLDGVEMIIWLSTSDILGVNGHIVGVWGVIWYVKW